ncbi:MAG TPA: transglycosylase SLT domain-containing protein [Burkholderiales bacterium]|nr:transglycosylase SLT domain-containing protein [Burkholderiales bacterium]
MFWVVAIAAMLLALNWIYQVVRKPAELFFPVSGVLNKTPEETWRQYEPIFRRHSTALMTPELLAALAQVEGAGNPVALTPWRVRASTDPREIYRPASSAVGMYQITDGTFRQARRYCIRDHVAVEDCWLNSLYMRVIPSHAVELTSAYLDRRVAALLEARRVAATHEQKQHLAAFMHLCGAGAGEAYARAGFKLAPGQRCGEHDPRLYLARVAAMKQRFARLSAIR